MTPKHDLPNLQTAMRKSAMPQTKKPRSITTAKGPDWIVIEGLYRASSGSLREIAREHGVTEGAIRARAKKQGWVKDIAGTKRQIVSERMAGITQGVTQNVMRKIQDSADEAARDMKLGLSGAQSILQAAVDSIGLQGMHEMPDGSKLALNIEPKDLKILSECIKINIETIRTIRELDPPPANPNGEPRSTLNVQALSIGELETLQVLYAKAGNGE